MSSFNLVDGDDETNVFIFQKYDYLVEIVLGPINILGKRNPNPFRLNHLFIRYIGLSKATVQIVLILNSSKQYPTALFTLVK